MTRRLGRPAVAVTLLVCAAALLVVGMDGPAAAHAELVGSEPPVGSPVVPGQSVTLWFSEGVSPAHSSMALVTADGARYPLAPIVSPAVDRRRLSAEVPGTVPEGAVAHLSWRAVADDGHQIDGSMPFIVTSPATESTLKSAAPPAAESQPSPTAATGRAAPLPQRSQVSAKSPVGSFLTGVRVIGYLALAVLVGGLAFLAVTWPGGADVAGARRLLWAALALGLVSSIAGTGLQAAYSSRLGLGSAVDPSVVGRVLDTPVGRGWATRALLFGLAAPLLVALGTRGRSAPTSLGWRVGAAAVGVALLRVPGLVGHASESRMAVIGSVADLLHLIGVAVWLGGLTVLCAVVLPRGRVEELREVVPRFSVVASAAVTAVVLGGSFMSWQLVGSFGGLTSTRFGHLLLAKVAMFTAAMGAAACSRRWALSQTRLLPVGAAERAVVRPFVVSVAAETVLAIGVVSVASLLVATSPGR